MCVIDTRAYLKHSSVLTESCIRTYRTGTSLDLQREGVCELF